MSVHCHKSVPTHVMTLDFARVLNNDKQVIKQMILLYAKSHLTKLNNTTLMTQNINAPTNHKKRKKTKRLLWIISLNKKAQTMSGEIDPVSTYHHLTRDTPMVM